MITKTIDTIKVLYDTPIDSTVTVYILEQEQTDKLFEGVQPYPKPCFEFCSKSVQRQKLDRYYERRRGNTNDYSYTATKLQNDAT